MNDWTDFNDAAPPGPANSQPSRDEIRTALLAQLESVLFAMFPKGRVQRRKFVIGDVQGVAGESLEVALSGERMGLWHDHATGEGGDVFALIASNEGWDAQRDFTRVLERAAELAGRASLPVPPRRKTTAVVDELGAPTAKWDYHDVDGQLIACVYRYDSPGGRKQFRPWDARRRKPTPPTPRPLYHQPGLAAATTVVLVEGEKCAQALIDSGVCATTAMHGANAPVDKTNWSPLAGKHVLIWPDKDKAGWDYALKAGEAILGAGAISCAVLFPPDNQPEGWDVADALAEGFDVAGFLRAGERLPVQRAERAEAIDFGESGWQTEDGLALAFTRRFGEDWRYCAAWGQWLVWTGQRWNPDRTLTVQHLARGICRAASVHTDKPSVQARLASTSTVMAVERLARSDRTHAATAEEWDRNPWALNTPGGVLDLRTGHMRGHERGERMTKLATATPKGTCSAWARFLSDVTGGDALLQAYLQRVVGYCLTGATSAHALFFLYGTGANGKSVFVNVIATILGDYATNAPMDTFMETRSDRHPTDLAGLRGARFVSAVETEQGRRWNESKLKAITGGDPISARFMRQDFFEYTPQFKLVIAGNHKPAIRNVDEAMKRRLHLIPFTVTVPPERRDGRLTEKLLAERDAILAWAMAGCLQWQRVGLQPPQCVLDATEEYFEEEDHIGEFVAEEFFLSAHARTSVADIYERWKQRAERRGEHIGSIRWLVQQLLARGFERIRLPGGAKALSGLSFKPREHPQRLPYADA